MVLSVESTFICRSAVLHQISNRIFITYLHNSILFFFVSVALTNNLTEDDIDRYYIIPDTTTSATSNAASGETTHARKEVTPATSPTSSAQAYIGLITGALAMVVLLLACTIFLMIRRGKKKVSIDSFMNLWFIESIKFVFEKYYPIESIMVIDNLSYWNVIKGNRK